jgi:dienelactone hydrolase
MVARLFRSGRRTAAAGAALLAALVGSTRAGTAQDLTSVPPRGTASIGWTSFALEAGPDDLTPDPGDRRCLLVEVWFPARAPGRISKPWASDAMGEALVQRFPFPEGFHAEIGTHAWLDAEPVEAAVPAVVFSHGLSFPPALYQSFFEDLASRGYAVYAVSHPHGAAMIEYPDGSTRDMALWPEIEDELERQRMLADAAGVWAADLRVVLDALSAGAPPTGVSIDAARIGLAGHSLGGTAVGKLSRDPRVQAVVAMEGDVREPASEDARGSLEIGAPLLHLIGGYNRLELERRGYLPGPGAPVFTAVVRGTGHAYFSDLIHFYRHYADRDWRERHRYELDPDRVIRIAGDYMAAFFDWRLRGQPLGALLGRRTLSEELAGPRQGGYPEVDLTIALR